MLSWRCGAPNIVPQRCGAWNQCCGALRSPSLHSMQQIAALRHLTSVLRRSGKLYIVLRPPRPALQRYPPLFCSFFPFC
ncbi:hypothetical protein TIFTF001_018693 [Ficus carica]|uniref:Uncharacterized protein n=1 Tax=Ficus carica TaxID=3494 RepID=A0AA88ABI3_FICCA|nr:hypothetical protein TIFTF001_018693 [Ficus carica]